MAIAPRLQVQIRTALRDLQAVKVQAPNATNTEILLMLILCEVRAILINMGGILTEVPEDNQL